MNDQSGSRRRLFLFFNLNDLFALISAAVRADVMGSTHVVAVRALGKVRAFEGQMAAATIAASLG